MRHKTHAQAIVELAFGMSALMLLLAGLVAVSIATATELGLVAVAQEAAHAAALSMAADEASEQGYARGMLVGLGYPLGNGSLAVQVDATQFRPGGQVRATATYTLSGRELFLFGITNLTISHSHVEPVALHRGLP